MRRVSTPGPGTRQVHDAGTARRPPCRCRHRARCSGTGRRLSPRLPVDMRCHSDPPCRAAIAACTSGFRRHLTLGSHRSAWSAVVRAVLKDDTLAPEIARVRVQHGPRPAHGSTGSPSAAHRCPPEGTRTAGRRDGGRWHTWNSMIVGLPVHGPPMATVPNPASTSSRRSA